MTHAMDIIGHTYQADTYCTPCTVHRLVTQGKLSPVAYRLPASEALAEGADARGIEWWDEHSFDSSDWPKAIFRHMVAGSEPCGSCGDDISDASSLDYDAPANLMFSGGNQ